jgi:hypothetical protein
MEDDCPAEIAVFLNKIEPISSDKATGVQESKG